MKYLICICGILMIFGCSEDGKKRNAISSDSDSLKSLIEYNRQWGIYDSSPMGNNVYKQKDTIK